VGAFPVWRPNLDELDVNSVPASGAFLSRAQTSRTTRFVQNMLTCLHVVGSEHCRTV
jgi:hypothetical protein